jgi:hypothetical protein
VVASYPFVANKRKAAWISAFCLPARSRFLLGRDKSDSLAEAGGRVRGVRLFEFNPFSTFFLDSQCTLTRFGRRVKSPATPFL